MATAKSIFEVEVKDEAFKKFFDQVKEYKEELGKFPGAWSAMGAAGQKAFEGTAAALSVNTNVLINYLEQQKKIEGQQKKENAELKKTETHWKNIATASKMVAGTALKITGTIAKWGIMGLGAGLLGGGAGLWGLGSLANGVSGMRRSSLGLGVTIGQQQAFANNFGRFVNPEQFLGGVNAAQTDISKRWGLRAAGLSESQISGQNTAQLSVSLLRNLRDIAKSTPMGMLAQTMEARGLNQFTDVQSMERLRNMSDKEFNAQVRRYQQDQKNITINDKVARQWQDLNTQLSRAKMKIELVFVHTLTPLVGPISRLSEAFSKAVAVFLQSDVVKGWMDSIGGSLERFSKYLSGKKFEEDFKYAISRLRILGEAVGHVADFINGIYNFFHTPIKDRYEAGRDPHNINVANQSRAWADAWNRPHNNPGNIRMPGGEGFMSYETWGEGYAALQKQLMLYFTGKSAAAGHKKLDTISSIVPTYAPAADKNDVAAYIKSVSSYMGVDPNKRLNLENKAVMAKLMAAIARQEGYKPDVNTINQVVGLNSATKTSSNSTTNLNVRVYNSTGANVDVSTASMVGAY